MKKELCFIIDNNELFLEQVLVEYMGVPIFFLCKDEEQYYITLCTDMENLNYVVSTISQIEVYYLLHGKQPMRDIFLSQNYFWEIHSSDDISNDEVSRKTIDKLDRSALPDEGACFKVLTTEIQEYVEKFDNDFWNNGYYSNVYHAVCNEDSIIDETDYLAVSIEPEINTITIKEYVTIGSYSMIQNISNDLKPEDFLYCSKESFSESKNITLSTQKQKKDWIINTNNNISPMVMAA